MTVRNIYLKIERIDNYSPVAPMDKTAPPILYGRDCRRGMGHANGVIPDAEIGARSLTGLVYRRYEDPEFLIPVVDKLVEADINEPISSRRVPGTVIYAYPGDTLRITVFNSDSDPHSFHTHGIDFGIDSDGAWPFGTQAADGRRSDEICPGSDWTYTFEIPDDALGAWPFHDHSRKMVPSISRGLF
ncbi:MAG: multicopper oxidase domain-containing protein, partial [Anaerolineae bacterium]|nr:multicopper oxidase domain-containing protein [Anaerolineae bacterium]